MIMQIKRFSRTQLAMAIAFATSGIATAAIAQEGALEDAEQFAPSSLEEVVVVGRLQSVAASLVDERLESPYSADFLGFEAISRAGDSSVGAALRRVTGVTLIDNKFIYIRGLGERYSNVTVNGASVPSPDLARSVIPLDLFPSSIVESLKVQKSWGPDLPANFGGGAIDIRTRNVPSGLVASVSIGTGLNTESDDGLGYPEDGSGSMPGALKAAINRYQGDLSESNIYDTENKAGNSVSRDDAEQIQRDLITSLNRNVAISEGSLDPDRDIKVDLGNAWDVADELVLGASISGAYDEENRNKNQMKRSIGSPETSFSDVKRTVHEERTTLALVLGAEYTKDQSLQLSHYVIQNDADEARITTSFSNNNPVQDNRPDIKYATRLEERELVLSQISGKHRFGDFSPLEALEMLDLEWFYSDAQATTDIPNATTFTGSLDRNTPEPTAYISNSSTAGQFEFLSLEDNVESWGGKFLLPIDIVSRELTLSGGWWNSDKSREYYGYTANVGTASTVGTPATVFTDSRINDLNNTFNLSMGSGFGNESYVAAQKIAAVFGEADFRFSEEWRFTAGARWEEYQQAVLPVNLLDFTGVFNQQLIEALQNPDQTFAIQNDDIYSNLALTYSGVNLLGANEFQVRFSVSDTVVRPDLRELADVAYIDPELSVRVFGNPSLKSTDVRSYDLRGEFYYEEGDNFTLSLFYKDLEFPIEQVEGAGSDDDTVLRYINGDSGSVYGIEFEGLKSLPVGLFLSGNVTLSDSEITITSNNEVTNTGRRLTGHSKYVFNTSLGYDSPDEQHSASLLYNVSSERIFFAGTSSNDDAFEQPFGSLDLIYNYYPTETVSVKIKLGNLLDSKREFEQKNSSGEKVVILEQDVGTSFKLSLNWKY
jgi:outer membrane receptor protein involved in Fe transport